jgi:hypothetical protein
MTSAKPKPVVSRSRTWSGRDLRTAELPTRAEPRLDFRRGSRLRSDPLPRRTRSYSADAVQAPNAEGECETLIHNDSRVERKLREHLDSILKEIESSRGRRRTIVRGRDTGGAHGQQRSWSVRSACRANFGRAESTLSVQGVRLSTARNAVCATDCGLGDLATDETQRGLRPQSTKSQIRNPKRLWNLRGARRF